MSFYICSTKSSTKPCVLKHSGRRADRRSKTMKRDAVLQQCPVFIKTQHFLKGFAQKCESTQDSFEKTGPQKRCKTQGKSMVTFPMRFTACLRACFFAGALCALPTLWHQACRQPQSDSGLCLGLVTQPSRIPPDPVDHQVALPSLAQKNRKETRSCGDLDDKKDTVDELANDTHQYINLQGRGYHVQTFNLQGLIGGLKAPRTLGKELRSLLVCAVGFAHHPLSLPSDPHIS